VKIISSILLGFLLFLSVPGDAQLHGSKLLREIQYSTDGGKVTIIQSNDITKYIDRHLYEAGKTRGITGYRIRIYSNSGKEAFDKGPVVQAEFSNRYKDVRAYYRFDSPFYRLYVGDFRTRSEAMKFLKEIEREYPDAFIVRTRISYPEL
jgi:hypothetical protein